MRTLAAAILLACLVTGCAGQKKSPGKQFEDREWPENCDELSGEERDYCLEARSKTQPPEDEPAASTESPEEETQEPSVENGGEPVAP